VSKSVIETVEIRLAKDMRSNVELSIVSRRKNYKGKEEEIIEL